MYKKKFYYRLFDRELKFLLEFFNPKNPTSPFNPKNNRLDSPLKRVDMHQKQAGMK